MRKWLIFTMPLMLLLAACSGGIFSDDFNDTTELPSLFQTDSLVAAPDAENNVLHLYGTETGMTESGFLTMQLEPDKTDYDVSMRVWVTSGSVRLWARRSNNCSGYALILDPNLDTYRLSTVDPATCTLQTIDSQATLQVDTQRWYNLRITAEGQTVSAYVDGVKYFETESDTFPTGFPAIEVANSRDSVGQVDIDNLTVK